MILTTLNFGFIFYCIAMFVIYLTKPNELKNQSGLIKAMNAAIAYDAISVLLLFCIFLAAVNMKLNQMMAFFYHGLPPFVFEIVF